MNLTTKDVFTGCAVQVLMVIVLLAFVTTIAWVQASMEAKTYNRLTGANVTTWEALWVELRVVPVMEAAK